MDRIPLRHSIRTRLLAAVLLPSLALAAFAGARVVDERHRADRSSRVVRLVRLSNLMGNVVHHVQKERGSSSLFLSSKGASGGPGLAAARTATDSALNELTQYLSSHGVDPSTADDVRTAIAPLDGRVALRAGVDKLTADVAATIATYTSVTSGLLTDLGALTSSATSDEDVTRSLTAYTSFLSAKESTGIERAALSNVFGTAKFAPGQLEKVGTLLGAQQAFLATFDGVAPASVRAQWDALTKDPVFAEVARYESLALDATDVATGAMDADPAKWYATATAKIDLMKKLEDAQAQKLSAIASDAHSKAMRSMWISLALALAAIGAALAFGFAIIHEIVRTLTTSIGALHRIARGDLTARADTAGRDELAQLAVALNSATESMQTVVVDVSAGMRELVDASHALDDVAEQLSHGASETASVASTTSAASEEVSVNASTVAQATRDLADGITLVAESSTRAAEVAGQAVALSDMARQSIDSLHTSSQAVSDIVEIINSIARRTNLLALNATIEAARAGATGRGFAVVANEVKQLAQQTSTATDDVTARIASMDADVVAAASTIDRIVAVIAQISETQALIASSVNQQSAVTADINRGIGEVSIGSGSISHAVVDVLGSVERTNDGAATTRSRAKGLADIANRLDHQVAQFHVV